MQLDESVPAHGVCLGFKMSQHLRARRLPAVHQRVRGDVISPQQLFPQLYGQVLERTPRVGELGGAASAGGRQTKGAEK